MIILSVMAFGAEIGQLFSMVAGSFDLVDLLLMIAALVAFLAIEHITDREECHE